MRSTIGPVLSSADVASSGVVSGSTIPWWLYPQVLSLDAPLIAVLWQKLFAKSFGATCGGSILFLTAACVWLIYVGDHALDMRAGVVYSARHRIVRNNEKWLRAVGVTLMTGSVIALWEAPSTLIWSGLGLSIIVMLYLAVVHCFERLQRKCPKEIAIGVIFALGSTIATWSDDRLLLRALPSIVLLAGACVLNCCAADYWEWDSHRILVRYPHRTTQFIARNLLVLTAGSSAISALLFLVKPDPTIAAAFLTLAFLMLIAKTTHRLQPETRRFLVDLALCTPVLFLMK